MGYFAGFFKKKGQKPILAPKNELKLLYVPN